MWKTESNLYLCSLPVRTGAPPVQQDQLHQATNRTFEDKVHGAQPDIMYVTHSAGGIFNFNILKVSLQRGETLACKSFTRTSVTLALHQPPHPPHGLSGPQEVSPPLIWLVDMWMQYLVWRWKQELMQRNDNHNYFKDALQSYNKILHTCTQTHTLTHTGPGDRQSVEIV